MPSVGLTHTSTPSMEVWRLPVLTREQAVMVCRWLLVHSTLGRARAGMLGWLVDAGDRSKQVRVETSCFRAGLGLQASFAGFATGLGG